jgi:(1->4)-alpha-D-glucan 1-alpha-D-glucosylmutase
MRFQQLTSPVMAKGVEDTAFYRYAPLAALNEVGGDPDRAPVALAAFHQAAAERLVRPRSLVAGSTHDTKRSEDVRARLAVLSQAPGQWSAFARPWLVASDASGVDRPTRYLLMQTLVGAWPLSIERATAHAEKAVREAKRHTSWTDPDDDYEAAVRSLVEGWFGDPSVVDAVDGFVASIASAGRTASLAQKLVQLTVPGVPDVYQGCEVWSLTLVDPDNRRPVDFERRRELLAALAGGPSPEQILAQSDEGLPKLWVVRQALHARRRLGGLGTYRPLAAGPAHVAFARDERLATVAPVRVVDDAGSATIDLPAGRWSNLLTGDDLGSGPVPVGDLLSRFPVALLERTQR